MNILVLLAAALLPAIFLWFYIWKQSQFRYKQEQLWVHKFHKIDKGKRIGQFRC